MLCRILIACRAACFVAAMAAIGSGVIGGPSAQAQSRKRDNETTVKSAFVVQFLRYVSWPENQDSDDDREFVISVVGESPMFDCLEELTSDQTVGGRKITVRRASTRDSLGHTPVVLIGSKDDSVLRETLRRVEGRPVLTIADADGFAEKGAMINLVTRVSGKGVRKVKFQVNQQATQEAGLKLSSQLLKLAEIVGQKER